MIINILCPSCNSKYEIEDTSLGRGFTCQICGKPFIAKLKELFITPGVPNKSFSCPSCGSEQTQNITVIYESGTSDISSSSIHGGFAFTGDGAVPVMASSSDNGVQQTALAKRLAPPQKKSIMGLLGCGCVISVILPVLLSGATLVILGSYFFNELASKCLLIGTAACSILIFILFCHLAIQNKKFNDTEYKELYNEWAKKYFCHKCGNLFTPKET